MNYIKTSLYAFLTIALLQSCKKDLLETIPNDRLSSVIYWKTDQDALYASNAVYTYLDGVDSYFSWDGMSDIGHTNSVTAQNALVERGQYDAGFAKILAEWTNSYAGIRAANSFLINVEKVQATDTALMKRLKGEMKVLRACFYTKLAALYGDVPLVTTEVSLDETRKLTRNPVTQVWDFVAVELTDAASALPVTQADKGRITKGAALALKARAMLYAGRYPLAAEAAKQVIDLNAYTLYPSYEKMFTYAAENNAEIVLDKQYIKSSYSNNLFFLMASWSQRNSNNTYVPTSKLVDSYEMNNGKDIADPASGFNPRDPYANRDPRLKYSVFTIGDQLPDGKLFNSKPGSGTPDAVDFSWFAPSTGYTVKKYINKEDLADPSNCGINLILIRYADVLLMYAEAKIEVNQIDQSVLDAINKVRQRADVNMPPITALGSQEKMRQIVRHERLVELAFEGLRYFDIRRWKIAETSVPGKVRGITYVDISGVLQTVEVPAFERVFNKNRDYLWPIPQKERELNPSLSQNQSW